MKGVKRRAALVITRKLVMFKDDLEIACHECFGGRTSHKPIARSNRYGTCWYLKKMTCLPCFLCFKKMHLADDMSNFFFSVSLFSCHLRDPKTLFSCRNKQGRPKTCANMKQTIAKTVKKNSLGMLGEGIDRKKCEPLL